MLVGIKQVMVKYIANQLHHSHTYLKFSKKSQKRNRAQDLNGMAEFKYQLCI